MPCASRTDSKLGDDKEERLFFSALEDGDCGSFFEMSYDFDGQTKAGSSDASIGLNLFEDLDLSSTSSRYPADAFVPSSTALSHGYHHQDLTEEQQQYHQDQGMKKQQQQQQNHHQEQEQGRKKGFNQHLHRVKPRREISDPFASDPQPEARSGLRAVPVPIPTSQRLVHRFRPDGVCISQEDLLSIEGRFRRAPSQTFSASRPRSPPSTPKQARSQTSPGATPRTPREQSCRVNKTREARLHTCKPPMQPSYYYHAGLEGQHLASSDWYEGIRDFKQDPSTPLEARQDCELSLPLSPPPSIRAKQRPHFAHPTDSSVSGARAAEAPSSPIAARCLRRTQRAFDTSEYSAHSYEHEELVSPVTPWINDTRGGFSFSPVSPMLDETTSWTAPGIAASPEQLDTSFAISPCFKAETNVRGACSSLQHLGYPATSQGGLMIDFGSSEAADELGLQSPQSRELDILAIQGELDYNQERQDLSDGSGTCTCVGGPCIDGPCIHGREDCHGTGPETDGLSDLQRQSEDRMWEADVAAAKTGCPDAAADSRSGLAADMSTRSGQLSGVKSFKRSSTATLSLDSSNATVLTRANKLEPRYNNGGGDARSTGRSSHGGSGDVFVNFTPSDSRKILTGVAPSGSSKTKARREKEAIERRRKLSEAAQRAVREAGGDWERVAGELVEV